jgi:hypothetical protein
MEIVVRGYSVTQPSTERQPAMANPLCLLNLCRSLQALCVESAIENQLPDFVDSGLYPLPDHLIDPALRYALALYSTAEDGLGPALPAKKVFAALRRSTFTTFDLLPSRTNSQPHHAAALAVLAALSPEQTASILGYILGGSSQRCVFQTIAVSTTNIATARALHQLLTVISASSAARCLTRLEICGTGTSALIVSTRGVRDITRYIGSFGALSVLRMSGLDAVNDENVVELVRAAGPTLKELDLSMTAVSGTGLCAALDAPGAARDSLVCLRLTGTNVDACSLLCLNGMAVLEELAIGWTVAVRPPSAIAGNIATRLSSTATEEAAALLGSILSATCLPNLRQLDVSGATIDVRLSCSSVTHFIMAQATVTDMLNRRLPANLEHLDLSDTTGPTALVASLLFDFAVTSPTLASSLRSINLAGSQVSGWGYGEDDVLPGPGIAVEGGAVVYDVSLSDLCIWFGMMKDMRQLDLSATVMMSSCALAAILSSGCARGIEVLRLRNVRKPSLGSTVRASLHMGDGDAGVHFRALTELDISGSEIGQSEAGLDRFLALCDSGRMQTLRMSGTYGVGDRVVSRAVARFGPSLKLLDVSNTRTSQLLSSKVEDSDGEWETGEGEEGGGGVVEGYDRVPLLPELQHVDARGCQLSASSDVIEFLSTHAPRLIRGELDDGDNTRRTTHTVGRDVALAARGRRIMQDAAARQLPHTPEWRRKDRSRVSFG